MSVLIKGMEMPESCRYCPFSSGGNRWVMPACILVGEDMERYEYNHRRMDDCPLVPVPPHGDLVDRDEMFVEFVDEGQKTTRYKVGEKWELNGEEIRRVIQRLPTIIPADPAEEGK